MVGRFATGLCAVVATRAVVRNAGVLERSGGPARSFMTILADVAGR